MALLSENTMKALDSKIQSPSASLALELGRLEFFILKFLIISILAGIGNTSYAGSKSAENQFLNLSIEELMNVSVTSLHPDAHKN